MLLQSSWSGGVEHPLPKDIAAKEQNGLEYIAHWPSKTWLYSQQHYLAHTIWTAIVLAGVVMAVKKVFFTKEESSVQI